MLNLHENHFPPQCDHDPHCPPPKPRFTLHEDMEKTICDMRHTIGHMLDFEKQLSEKVEEMLKHLTTDNVTFKETFNAAYSEFLKSVQAEVNGFESSMTNAYRLFTTTVEANYANLDSECKAQIEEYYNDVILYIKSNINGAVADAINEMRTDGTLDGFISSELVVTPELFGAKGDGVTDDTEAFTTMFFETEGTRRNFLFKGKYLLKNASWFTVDENSILTSLNATFIQPTFGRGVFRVSGNNIHFRGTFNFEQTGTKTELSDEGTGCSALLIQDTASHIYIDTFNIKNFVGGVVLGGSDNNDIIAKKIYVENCDFGVWGANAHNVVIDVLEFKDVSHSQGEPAHALYLTGNDGYERTSNVHIGTIYGIGCNADATDSVVSVKSTSNFYCDRMCVTRVSKVFDVLNSFGYIKNVNADEISSYCFTVQGNLGNEPFVVKDCYFDTITQPLDEVIGVYSVGANASVLIENCKFINIAQIKDRLAYISNVKYFEERNCVYEKNASLPDEFGYKCYEIASSDHGLIHNPTIKGFGLVRFVQSGVNFVFEIDPSKLCASCNDITYKTVFLPNEHFATVTDIDNNAIYNNIISEDAIIIKLRGNGIFTLVNKNASSAIMDNGTGSLVLKGGLSQYAADEWKVKVFRVIDSVGYEI